MRTSWPKCVPPLPAWRRSKQVTRVAVAYWRFSTVSMSGSTATALNGCTFINASAEYPRKDCPIHRACMAHKERVLDTLESLLSDMPLADPRHVALEVELLAEGAIVLAHTAGDLQAARVAKGAAGRLLASYL